MFRENGENPLAPKAIQEGNRQRNLRDGNYFKLMDSLTEEQLAQVRVGQFKVVVKDNVRALVKKQ